MYSLYEFITGPLVWISFAVFIGGCVFKFLRMLILVYKKEQFIFSFMSFKYGLRSVLHWITPFGARNMRLNPVMTIVTFVFHICLLAVPIFLLSHIVLVEESWNITWWSIPDRVADVMAMLVVLACLFFLGRRLMLPQVKYVTSASDFVLLSIVAAPFITGIWAYHQMPGYPIAMIVHILSGELMLVVIPFTRLSHMIYALFTRAYMGSEFGSVKHARDW